MTIKDWMRSSRKRIPSDKNAAHYQQVQQAIAELDKAIRAMRPSGGEVARRVTLDFLSCMVLMIVLLIVMGLFILVVVHPMWGMWGGWGLVVVSQVVAPNTSSTERAGGLLNGCMFCISLTTMTPPLISLTVADPGLGSHSVS